MLTRTTRLQKAPRDDSEWSRLFAKHKEEYLRKRLRVLKLSWEGLSQSKIRTKLGCSKSSIHRWIDAYLSGGYAELLQKHISGATGKGQLSSQ